MSGLWRACHPAVLPFNRTVSRGHPSSDAFKVPVLVRPKADCVPILGIVG